MSLPPNDFSPASSSSSPNYSRHFMHQKPENYLVWAILSCICCCVPTGIAAIVFAAQVDGKYAAGDYEGAQKSSDQAKMWSLISLGAGILFTVLYVGLGVLQGSQGY